MKKLLTSLYLMVLALTLAGQSFEVHSSSDVHKGVIGHTIYAPLIIANTTEKTLLLQVKRIYCEIGSSQMNYLCIGNKCQTEKVEEITIKLAPGEVFNHLRVALEAGLSAGTSIVRYTIANKTDPIDAMEFDVNFNVEEKKINHIYQSPFIILYDVYPNPIADDGYIEYRILNEAKKAKILIHNILGNNFDEIPLPAADTKVKIETDALSPGIYFYTLYLDKEAVATRKLVVKK